MLALTEGFQVLYIIVIRRSYLSFMNTNIIHNTDCCVHDAGLLDHTKERQRLRRRSGDFPRERCVRRGSVADETFCHLPVSVFPLITWCRLFAGLNRIPVARRTSTAQFAYFKMVVICVFYNCRYPSQRVY